MSIGRTRMRVLVVTVSALLVLVVMAGCSKKKDGDASSKSTTTAVSAQTVAPGGDSSASSSTSSAVSDAAGGTASGGGADGGVADGGAAPDGGDRIVPPSVDTSKPFEQKIWTLDTGASEPKINSVMPILIQFDGDKVTGNGGCNTFNGSLAIDGTSVTIKDVTTSGIPCGIAEDEASEKAFLNELKGAQKIEVEPETVVLTTRTGRLVFIFA